MAADNRLRVAVIGGGVTGLAAAYKLHDSASAQVTVFDAASHAGGTLQSTVRDGYLIERGADSFITDPPHALELCRRLGLEKELIGTASSDRRALVLCRGRLVSVPDGFVVMAPNRIWPLVQSPLLSIRGKLRVLEEPLVPPRSAHLDDESVADFARRRFGVEAYDRLIQPLVGGIYTGNPELLGMAATMTRFWEAERVHGSILRARRADGGDSFMAADERTSGARYDKFVSLRRGMVCLVDSLVASLPPAAVRFRHRATGVIRDQDGWRVQFATEFGTQTQAFDGVIIATPAAAAARLLTGGLAEKLSVIQSTGASVVSLGFRREAVAHPLDAFGFVVPQIERRQILAGSFLSTKFADRTPYNCVMLRVFVGGALQPELVELPEEELLKIVEREIHELLGTRGSPQVVDIARWHGAMPQYHVGHVQLVEEIERLVASLPGLAVAGNAYHGVGIAQCVHSGEAAAGRILDSLRSRHGINRSA